MAGGTLGAAMTLVMTDRHGSVAVLTLNRPERHNSLTPALLEQLLGAIDQVAEDDGVGAVVLRAEGKSFSTGGDVAGFFAAGDNVGVYASEIVGLLNKVMLGLIGLAKPVVAAVHGMVTGGSLGLLLAADVVLMAPAATITPWYSVVGFSPDGGWTAILPQIIGRHRAAHLLLSNATMTAEQALEWGLAAEIVSPREIDTQALEIATEMAGMKPGSIAGVKRLLGTAAIAPALEAERAAFVHQITTDEAREGMAAFLGGDR